MRIPGTIKGGTVILEQPVPARVPDGTHVMVEVPEEALPRPLPDGTYRQPGGAKGILEIVQDDDEHLKDFKEYM